MMSNSAKGKPQDGKISQTEELKTEGPISEKDEVKAAERRTANQQKKAATLKSVKK